MTRISKLAIAVSAALCCTLANPTPAFAQDSAIRNVYHNTVSIRYTIRDVGHESKSFRHEYEKRFDHSFHPDWRRSNDQRKAIQKMDEALEVVTRREADGEKPQYIRDDVATTLKRARIVDRLSESGYDALGTLSDEWKDLKASLDQLADIYDLPHV